MPSTVPSTIILHCVPRSTSTMFECALLERGDIRVLHEPMGDAFYFGPEKLSDRYSRNQCDEEYAHYKESTFKKTWENIITPTDPPRTFSKDMAQYIVSTPTNPTVASVPSLGPPGDGNPTVIPTSSFLSPSIVHTFLIRTPKKAIPSYYRLCYPGAPTGFDHFDPDEAGYRELRLVFDFVRSQGGATPLLIDSDDLLADPEGVMQMWCEKVGIEFNPDMLNWGEGVREHFAKWKGFHDAAEGSTGVGKGVKSGHSTPKSSEPLPQLVEDCIAANMADYEYLLQFASKPSA